MPPDDNHDPAAPPDIGGEQRRDPIDASAEVSQNDNKASGGANLTSGTATKADGKQRDGGYNVVDTATPPAAPVTSSPLLQLHGVELAKIVLGVVAMSIVLLLTYLGVMDIVTSKQVNDVYGKTLDAVRMLPGPINEPDLNELQEKLSEFIDGHVPVTDQTKLPLFKNTLKDIESAMKIYLPQMSSLQAERLENCETLLDLPPSTAPKLEVKDGAGDCILLLNTAKLASANRPVDLDRLRLLRDFETDAHDNRQALRSFWLQAAQLILLNLLLPMVTALLGYTFGQQVARSSESTK